MARSKFLRFVFSPEGQGKIQADTVASTDEPISVNPSLDNPFPQSWKISFKLKDPADAGIKVYPMFAGDVRFIAAPAPGKVAPSQLNVKSENYDQWPTIGKLLVINGNGASKADQNIVRGHFSNLELAPTHIWYSPVRITKEFLFSGLFGVRNNGGSLSVASRKLISSFLKGKASVPLKYQRLEADDDVEKFSMPCVVPHGPGGIDVDLVISAANQRPPYDYKMDKAEGNNLGKMWSPHDKLNGAIPARHVYRRVRENMLDNTGVVLDRLLAEWPSATGYVPIRFTRIWKPEQECSIYFPSQTVTVHQGIAGTPVQQRLPSHGLVYFPLGSPVASTEPLTVHIESPADKLDLDMKMLDGATSQAWRVAATAKELEFQITDQSPPTSSEDFRPIHIILRRRMNAQILTELPPKKPNPPRSSCTYMSMRRAVRALIDLRITGGRLYPSAWADYGYLIEAAWEEARTSASAPLKARWERARGLNSALFRNNGPPEKAEAFSRKTGTVASYSRRFEPVLSAFFPEDAATLASGQTGTVLSKGEVAYGLWQTILGDFMDPQLKHNYPLEHIGHGAAGAIAFLGLGEYTNPKPMGESWPRYAKRLRDDLKQMLAGLEQGAMLQFWHDADLYASDQYMAIKNRQLGGGVLGHSIIVLGYFEGDQRVFDVNKLLDPGYPIKLGIIDQNGVAACFVKEVQNSGTTVTRLFWPTMDDTPMELWLGANWKE